MPRNILVEPSLKKKIYNHIPHNVASSPYYEPMIDAIADVGRGVAPPTPWEITHTYLDNEVDEMRVYVDSYGKYWDEYGCTLMCDGWSTQNRRKIINFLVYSTYGTVFLKSVDATDKFQNADYICSLMDDVVRVIGESRVVQVVTDNGANYKKAGQQLMLTRKHLYWTLCAAHCIDLIFHDMAKEDDVKNMISQCQQLTGFIYNHGWVLSLMRRETKNRELIRPAITRFATHFIALDFIYLHRNDLRRMIIAREWAEKYPRLGTKDKKNAEDVYRMIHSDKFWKDIASIIVVFEPLVKVLRLVDSDDKADMGYLYEAMDRAKEAIKKNIGRDYKKWWGIIDRRWDRQLHQDIHAAG